MSSVKSTLFHLYQSAELVEAAFAETEGEETDETKSLEALNELAAGEALESLSAFVRHCELGIDNVNAEAERLGKAHARISKANEWGKGKIREILERLGKTKSSAGAFKITTRAGVKRCVVQDAERLAEAIAMREIPDSLLNIKPEHTIEVPESRKLDKREALAVMKKGEAVAGCVLVTGERTIKVV